MQLRIDRHTLIIIHETDQDMAYLEDTLCLKEDGDVIKFERINDESKSWVNFRVESYAPYIDESYESSNVRRIPKKRIDTSRYKDICDPLEEREQITLNDIESLE